MTCSHLRPVASSQNSLISFSNINSKPTSQKPYEKILLLHRFLQEVHLDDRRTHQSKSKFDEKSTVTFLIGIHFARKEGQKLDKTTNMPILHFIMLNNNLEIISSMGICHRINRQQTL
jgi:hypothetical protein